jgi:hypothetical protein
MWGMAGGVCEHTKRALLGPTSEFTQLLRALHAIVAMVAPLPRPAHRRGIAAPISGALRPK